MSSAPPVDGRRARGDASRRAILAHATDLASVTGLDGLSIGALAEASGTSKSSIATLFRSKEGLQLAAVATARDIFQAQIIDPARAAPRGAARLATLLRNALIYSRDRVFAGGCFFAATAAELDSKAGPVRDAIETALRDWYAYLTHQAEIALADGSLHTEDPEALAFTLVALNEHANARSLLSGRDAPYRVAASGMQTLLRTAQADEKVLAVLDWPLAPRTPRLDGA